ncbi:hypothetical protein V3C99_008941 [Haemonchus contortus]
MSLIHAISTVIFSLPIYRLAPEGPMRELFKDCPIFGVDAGVITPGYIHVGQTVYVRYKRAFQKASLFHRL